MKLFCLTALCALGVCVSAADVHYANPLNRADSLKHWWIAPGTGAKALPGNGIEIIASKGAGGKFQGVVRGIPAEPLRGKFVRVSVEAKAENLQPVGNTKTGGKFMFTVRTPKETFYPQKNPDLGSYDWKTYSLDFDVPRDCDKVDFGLGIEHASGKILFRNLKVEIMASSPKVNAHYFNPLNRTNSLENWWVAPGTKAKALEKLSAIYVKVGYPDQWRDYSSLDIKKDSYWANVLRSNVFEYDYMLAKNGKPVDKTEWMMTPQTVNAYYNPTTNEICFPAGILQYPFFDMKADDAFNYGAIGVVIGHEMTHGFDNHGRQYDKDGNLRDWWTAEDAKKFEERTQVLVDWFDKIEVLPGLHANGKLTLGENIADYGGLQVAFQAFHNAVKDAPLGVVDGFTPEQRFYLAYAGVWAANIRDEEIRLRTQTDEHSLGRWRVNATLPHIEGWYEAFSVQEGDPMYLAPDKRASIW